MIGHARRVDDDKENVPSLEARVKLALADVINNKTSYRAAADRFHVDRTTLAKYHRECPRATAISDVVLADRGRRPSLSSENMSTLKIFANSMENVGYQISRTTLKTTAVSLMKMEDTALPEKITHRRKVPVRESITTPTIKKIVKKIGLRERTVRQGPSKDLLRESKCKVEYLSSIFDVLENVYGRLKCGKDAMLVFDVRSRARTALTDAAAPSATKLASCCAGTKSSC
jgi:hypothetical protein